VACLHAFCAQAHCYRNLFVEIFQLLQRVVCNVCDCLGILLFRFFFELPVLELLFAFVERRFVLVGQVFDFSSIQIIKITFHPLFMVFVPVPVCDPDAFVVLQDLLLVFERLISTVHAEQPLLFVQVSSFVEVLFHVFVLRSYQISLLLIHPWFGEVDAGLNVFVHFFDRTFECELFVLQALFVLHFLLFQVIVFFVTLVLYFGSKLHHSPFVE